jgi:hypothetical protein
VVLAVEFLQNHLEVCAHRPEYLFQALEVRGAKDLPSPLGDKHQVLGIEGARRELRIPNR